MDSSTGGQSTRAIHASTTRDGLGAPHLPIYNTTTFTFQNTAALLDVVEGRTKGSLYSRLGLNPNVVALEETMASIEGVEKALAFSSGMAAITALFAAYGRSGIVCIGDAYGGTLELLTDQLPLLGISAHFLLGSEIERLEGLLESGTRLVFFETPTNPRLEIFDVAKLSALAHSFGALVAIDNTFASPVNQLPHALGADIVLYSATKSLGGHSDVTGGLLLGDAELIDPIWPWRKNFGTSIAPEPAALLSRSLRTLAVRVNAQTVSAQAIADELESDRRVTRVFYPGLKSFPGHELASAQMSGFGGMLTIEVAGDAHAAAQVVDRLSIFSLAPSLGGVESLVSQPTATSHHGLSAEELGRRGITDSMIRLSVGLEDTVDLIADLTHALDAMR